MANRFPKLLILLTFSLIPYLSTVSSNAATTPATHDRQNSGNWRASSTSGRSMSSNDFPHFTALDPKGQFNLFWKFDDEMITFQVHAATKGWAGLGFSPNGGMAGADMVVFWVDASGQGVISDRYGTENSFPREDAHQDYNLIDATKNDTHIMVTFSRKRSTCDQEDWPLAEGTTRVIYAINSAMPESKDSFRKHTTRGSKSVHLFDDKPLPDKPLPEKDAKPLEIKVSRVSVPDAETTLYWCEVMKLPKFSKKMHMIKVDPLIEPQNADVVHHILAYICTVPLPNYVGKGKPCFKKDGDDDDPVLGACKQSLLTGWAVGGESSTFPDNMGFPIYNDGGDIYIMMEMHYENPDHKRGKVDSSGFRLWLTENLRQIDAGQMTLGVPVDASEQVIPPGQKEFTNYGYCSADCTAGFPRDGIKILGGFLHTHLTGRKIRVHHFRNGKQLPPVLADEHYDFNYQDGRRLKDPVTVLPGDTLVVECVYETLDRTDTTFSGPSTHNEMCLAFLDYFPAIYRGFVCISSPDKRKLYEPLGVEIMPFNESAPLETSVMMPDGKKKPLPKYLKQDFKFDWTQDKIDQLQKSFRDSQHTVICLRQGLNQPKMDFKPDAQGKIQGLDFYEQAGYPKSSEPWTPTDICSGQQGGSSSNNRDQNRSNRNGQAISSTSQLRENNAGREIRIDILIILSSIFMGLWF